MPRTPEIDGAALAKTFKELGSIGATAKEFRISFHTCRRLLGENGVQVKPREVLDLAARDHTVRRILLLLQANGSMDWQAIVKAPGCTDCAQYLGWLEADGYLSAATHRRKRRYELTAKGQRLWRQAEQLYASRQRGALEARRREGMSIKDLAQSTGMSERAVSRQLQDPANPPVPRVSRESADIEAMVKAYVGTTASLRQVAKDFGMPYGTCRYLLLTKGGVDPKQRGGTNLGVHVRRARDLVDLAASDHAVRRILLALHKANGWMWRTEIRALPGCSSSDFYLTRLTNQGYLSKSVGSNGHVYYGLTEAGKALVADAQKLHKARQPEALVARKRKGHTTSVIAEDVRMSVSEVENRVRIYGMMANG